MDKPDHDDLADLARMMVEEARHGGPEAVRHFIDYGEFNLSGYVNSFRSGWRLALFHPVVYRRHMLWKEHAGQLTPGTPEYWDLLGKAERNLTAAEFGRLDLSPAERARLRIIRQSYGLTWWTFRGLVCNLGAQCKDQRLHLREPPKVPIQAISIARKVWAAISCFVILGGTLQLLAQGCLDCTSAGALFLAPTLLVVWWFLHELSEGWQSSFLRLRSMSI